jgi:hypothetical protein
VEASGDTMTITGTNFDAYPTFTNKVSLAGVVADSVEIGTDS